MRNLIQNRAFIIGFFSGFLLFVLIVEYIDKKDRPICFDCAQVFGFPFSYLETGGQAFSQRYIWFGLIANILIATAFSFIIGFVFKLVWTRITLRPSLT